jgi:general secretion pathway protein I
LPGKGGFTLLEVMLAMAILALCVVPLLGAITQGLRATSRIERITAATELARNKLVQIELETMPDVEETREGAFGPPHQDFSWRAQYLKRAELQLLEDQLPGLKTMELHLSVIWIEGGAEQSVDFSTLLVQ